MSTTAPSKIPPGPKGNFLLGNTLSLIRDQLGNLTRWAREYGDIFKVGMPGMVYYVLTNPEHIEYVLRGNHKNFIKDKWSHQLESLVGQGLLTSEGDFWKRQRQMAQPAFQRERIQEYGTVMAEYAQRLLQQWQEGQERDIRHDMMRLTLDIVAKTLFESGADRYAQEVGEGLEAAMEHFYSPLSIPWMPLWLPIPSFWRYRRAVKKLNDIMGDIIGQHRARGKDADDLLSRLLAARDEAGGRMTDQQLRDELLTLLLAGHETTAMTLTYTFYLLAKHPAVAEKLWAELDEHVGDRPPTPADMPSLRYTHWVVQEAMRLYPPVWSIAREAIGACEIGGYPVPKGTQLWLLQWVVHRDPRWYEEPEAFRPERWDNDLARRLPRCAYFPFGDGPRICIGQHFAMLEAPLLLATLARQFRLELVPGQTLRLFPSITLRPQEGIRMVVRKRGGKGNQ